uniref:Transmembrane protein n=1 Tax=Glossina pallidipes TaxID=7398 RepID=A0A1A9Z8Y5_GLOPL
MTNVGHKLYTKLRFRLDVRVAIYDHQNRADKRANYCCNGEAANCYKFPLPSMYLIEWFAVTVQKQDNCYVYFVSVFVYLVVVVVVVVVVVIAVVIVVVVVAVVVVVGVVNLLKK